jgi:VanZ family protein
MISSFSKILLIIILLATLVFAFAPGPWTPAWIVNHDKFSHLIVFLLLGILIKLAFPITKRVIVIALLVVFAVFIETLQYTLFNRGFSIEDIVYDLFVIGLFFIIFPGFQVLKLKLKKLDITK